MNLSKRFLLVIPAVFVILMPAYPEKLANYWYVTSMSFVSSWTIFWNFPKIGQSIQSKPVYTEDLVEQGTHISENHKFMRYYTITTNFCLAILATVMSDYALTKNYEGRDLTEIAGTLGGIIALYLKCQDAIAKLLLTICYYMKNREVLRRIREEGLELKNISSMPNISIDTSSYQNDDLGNEK